EGIYIFNSFDIEIDNNFINDNHFGIDLRYSKSIIIKRNTIANSTSYGIELYSSNINIVAWNNFSKNNLGSSQVYDDQDQVNTYAYNFWDDWTSPDNDNDGIVDNPYPIAGNPNNQDSYPLTTPFNISTSHFLLAPLVIYPNGGETLNESVLIEWRTALDSQDHGISYDVLYSADSGSSWNVLVSGLIDTFYNWNFLDIPEGDSYFIKIRARCSEGLITEDISDTAFQIIRMRYITGIVSDLITQSPIKGVILDLFYIPTPYDPYVWIGYIETGDDGVYVFSVYDSGEYYLSVIADGYYGNMSYFVLIEGIYDFSMDISLLPHEYGSEAVITFLDWVTLDPLENVKVYVYQSSLNSLPEVISFSNSSGHVVINNIGNTYLTLFNISLSGYKDIYFHYIKEQPPQSSLSFTMLMIPEGSPQNDANSETDAGDDFSNAILITNDTYQGSFDETLGDTQDWYVFEFTGFKHLELEFSAYDDLGSRFAVYIYDETLDLLSQGINPESITEDLSAGRYYLCVEYWIGAYANYTFTLNLTKMELPDLVISTLIWSPTDNINDGDVVTFTAIVENLGNTSVIMDFYVGFEIDGVLIGLQHIEGLSDGASTDVSLNWLATGGIHTIRVITDYYDEILEANETNNDLSQILPGIPLADLVIIDLTYSPTELISDGEIIVFTALIENIGAGNTSTNFYVGFEIDGNYIGKQHVNGLLRGSSVEVSLSWQVVGGVHTVQVVIDYYNGIIEFNESNNDFSIILAEILISDLIIVDIGFIPSADIKSGDIIRLNATIENIGAGNATKSFYVDFFINNSYIGRTLVSGLTIGKNVTVSIDWVASGGNYTIKVIVDKRNDLLESDESNNEGTKDLPEIPLEPQVVVTSPLGGESWSGVQDITWQATSPQGLDLTIKIELFDGFSYILIADNLPNTGIFSNWDTAKAADGSSVPDDFYYKIRITASDTNGVSGFNISDNWFTIWNTPRVEISQPFSLSPTIHKNTTYTITVSNINIFTDTFDLLVNNLDNIAVVELSSDFITLDPWQSGTITLNVSDQTPGTYQVIVSVVSRTNSSVFDEVTITTVIREAYHLDISFLTTQTSIGGSLIYNIILENYQDYPDTFSFEIEGIESSWYSLNASIRLIAGEKKIFPLKLSIPGTASAGDFLISVKAISSNLGIFKIGTVFLNLSTEPIIFNLLPLNNTLLSSSEVIISWKTSVNSTSELYIKKEDESTFNPIIGDPGLSHIINTSTLSKNSWYEFYIRSESDYGAATSDIRRIFICTAISFEADIYHMIIKRDYDQKGTLSIFNNDDEPHEVLLNITGVPNDLFLNFVGEGSIDQVMVLFPGETMNIHYVIHAQDALQDQYNILLSLKTVDSEEIFDSATLVVHITEPIIDFTLQEVSYDPVTLTRKYMIINHGDALTDLKVSASPELTDFVIFTPTINHYYLKSGEAIVFDVSPVLSEGYSGADGNIIAYTTGKKQIISASFTLPTGMQVYKGQIGIMSIDFVDEFDNDDSPNSNPLEDRLVESYKVDNRTMFACQIVVEVLQDEKPVYDANVTLIVWNSTTELIITGLTDIYGRALFNVYGPPSLYSYKAELVEFGLSTETRSFSVDEAFLTRIFPSNISWNYISDSNSSFTINSSFDYSGMITLDNA
ncbi:MAG: CARDB domain-containing protein, partial [Candidatus Hodarchaeota archaeon]